MKKERNEFIKAIEVVALHIERYSRQVDRLLSVQDYSDEDYYNSKVGKTQYYRQRNKKIKAYSDAIDTMIQKERLLQFDTSGFKISITEEKTEVNYSAKSKYNLNALTLEEKIEVLKLMQKAKKHQIIHAPITYSDQKEETVDVEAEVVEEKPNINQIKQIEAPPVTEFTLRPVDPVTKLQQTLNKMAAQRFGEVGTLTTEEKGVYDIK